MIDRETLRDLGPAEALDAAVTARRTADRAEADLLAVAVHYVDLCPALDDEPAAGWADRGLDGHRDPLGGAGTPSVAEFAVEELAAALGIGYHTALQLVTDAVELCYRLPRLWALIHTGHLQAWKARQVAAETTTLSRAAVAFVDRHLAVSGTRNNLPNLKAVVHEALLQCDPDAAAGVEQAALDRRGVWFDHRESTATTQLTATLDTPDALDLDTTLSDLATTLATLGDRSDLDIRRATALGMLAHPHPLSAPAPPPPPLGARSALDTRRATALGMLAPPQRALNLAPGTPAPAGDSNVGATRADEPQVGSPAGPGPGPGPSSRSR